MDKFLMLTTGETCRRQSPDALPYLGNGGLPPCTKFLIVLGNFIQKIIN